MVVEMSSGAGYERDDRDLATLVTEVLRAFVSQLHERLDAAGYSDIRPAHGHVFYTIGAEGGRVVDMAERAQLTKQAMAKLVADLEERGYLEREPDPADRRAKIVRLTDAGWAAVRVAAAAIADIERQWAREIGEERLRVLRETLAELAARYPRTR